FPRILKALNSQSIRSFDRPSHDISPIIGYFHFLGPNDSLDPITLTHKLWWLLAICGFLRPSDIARIDDLRSYTTYGSLLLDIAGPKERRLGQRIERMVVIQPHQDPLLCPVQAYTSYKSRIATTPCPETHPVISSRTIHCLVHDVRSHGKFIHRGRINNHIKSIMDLMPRPPGSARPKTRALGPFVALSSGAFIGDILTYGSWDSSKVFDSFYRLSRHTQENLSNMPIPCSRSSLETQQESPTHNG
ncbi:hypothetical protein CLU79DRAFT_692623, partial [Phycomyces nitens]